jgi:hypothetical protein
MAEFSTLSGTVSHASTTSFVRGAVKKGKGLVDQAIRAAALSILSSMVLTACDSPPSQGVTEVEALELLNAGKVTEIGVSHSGWTTLTLSDGSYVQNRAEIIGYPAELLSKCASCDNVIQWIE